MRLKTCLKIPRAREQKGINKHQSKFLHGPTLLAIGVFGCALVVQVLVLFQLICYVLGAWELREGSPALNVRTLGRG